MHEYAWWILVVSLLTCLIGFVVMFKLVARIPADYFQHHQRHHMPNPSHSPLLRLVIIGSKNLFGAILLLAGIIMLFTPGQGLLSILLGLMLMNYPGKYRLECWLINRPMIFKTVNSIRQKQGKSPLLPPQSKAVKESR